MSTKKEVFEARDGSKVLDPQGAPGREKEAQAIRGDTCIGSRQQAFEGKVCYADR